MMMGAFKMLMLSLLHGRETHRPTCVHIYRRGHRPRRVTLELSSRETSPAGGRWKRARLRDAELASEAERGRNEESDNDHFGDGQPPRRYWLVRSGR